MGTTLFPVHKVLGIALNIGQSVVKVQASHAVSLPLIPRSNDRFRANESHKLEFFSLTKSIARHIQYGVEGRFLPNMLIALDDSDDLVYQIIFFTSSQEAFCWGGAIFIRKQESVNILQKS